MKKHILLSLVALLALLGCGGGGSSNNENAPDRTISQTGKLFDDVIVNMRYTSKSHSGQTNENGEFTYKKGEKITFHLANMSFEVKQIPEDKKVFLTDLFDDVDRDNLTNTKVVKLATILQGLDTTAKDDNKIVLDNIKVNEILKNKNNLDDIKPSTLQIKHISQDDIIKELQETFERENNNNSQNNTTSPSTGGTTPNIIPEVETNLDLTEFQTSTYQTLKSKLKTMINDNIHQEGKEHPDFTFDFKNLEPYFENYKGDLKLDMNSIIPLKIIDKNGQKLENIEWFLYDRSKPYGQEILHEKETRANELITIKDDILYIRGKAGDTSSDYGHIIGLYKKDGKEYIYRLNYEINSKEQTLLNNQKAENLKWLNDKTDEILKGTYGLSDYEKVQYIHDYLAKNLEYSYSAMMRRDPYWLLSNKKAVCYGYSHAFKYFMNKLGIKSEVELGDSSQGYHAWNIVYIDDGWYYLDVTWAREIVGLSTVDADLFNLEREYSNKYSAEKLVSFIKSVMENKPMQDVSSGEINVIMSKYNIWKNQKTNVNGEQVPNKEIMISRLSDELGKDKPQQDPSANVDLKYKNFLIPLNDFKATHQGARKYQGRTMGTSHLNNEPNIKKTPIMPENFNFANAPKLTFVGTAEGINTDSGILQGMNSKKMQYFNGLKWKNIEASGEVEYKNGFFLVREVDINGKVLSKYQTIHPLKHRSSPVWIKQSSNTLSNLSGNIEYKKTSDATWRSVSDIEITLPNGTYQFRLKGGENLLPSGIYEIIIP